MRVQRYRRNVFEEDKKKTINSERGTGERRLKLEEGSKKIRESSPGKGGGVKRKRGA